MYCFHPIGLHFWQHAKSSALFSETNFKNPVLKNPSTLTCCWNSFVAYLSSKLLCLGEGMKKRFIPLIFVKSSCIPVMAEQTT